MTQEVVTLVVTNELDPWAFVQPFVTIHPLALVELLVAATAAWLLPKWRYGIFVAAVVAPLWLTVFFLPGPVWFLPLGATAALNAAHFSVVLAVYSIVFGVKRLTRRATRSKERHEHRTT